VKTRSQEMIGRRRWKGKDNLRRHLLNLELKKHRKMNERKKLKDLTTTGVNERKDQTKVSLNNERNEAPCMRISDSRARARQGVLQTMGGPEA